MQVSPKVSPANGRGIDSCSPDIINLIMFAIAIESGMGSENISLRCGSETYSYTSPEELVVRKQLDGFRFPCSIYIFCN